MLLPTLFGVLAFLVAYWQWMLIGAVVAGGLVYASLIMRNWKLVAAAGVIAALFVTHQWVYVAGYKAKERKVQAEIVRIMKLRDELIKEASEADKSRAAADAARIAELEKMINATPKDNRIALPRAAAGRVRNVR